MSNFSSSKIARFLLVPLLSLWVAGGCMLGCGGIAVAAAPALDQNSGQSATSLPAGAIVVSGHSCSSGGTSASSATVGSSNETANHNCCKKSKTEVKPKTQPPDTRVGASVEVGTSSSGMMTDCPLAGSKSAVITKGRGVEANASQTAAHSYLPEQNSLKWPSPLFATPLLPNRGHTYLRCCAFLI